MRYDFDKIVDRRGTDCLKYDFASERGRHEGILPLWVADMDFSTAPVINERLRRITEHGIYGYSDSKEQYFNAVAAWFEKHFSWNPKREWLIKIPGVVFALAAAVRAYTEPGDAVILQQPVYYPFTEVICDNDRRVINSPLKQVNGRYEMDFEDFERKIEDNDVKLFLMCSPHNPVGRVWTEAELKKVGEICLRHGTIVVSDEIHSDFTWDGHRHSVFASLSEAFANMSVICTAPSKTFNIAGLQISNIFIPNESLRKRFKRAVDAAGYSQVNVMGLEACQAAYEGGEEWLLQLKAYLEENIAFSKRFVDENMPEIGLTVPEGTYLLWLDFRKLGLDEDELKELIENEANLWLDSGAMFGPDGEGFERINVACPRAVLRKALEQLASAVSQREGCKKSPQCD